MIFQGRCAKIIRLDLTDQLFIDFLAVLQLILIYVRIVWATFGIGQCLHTGRFGMAVNIKFCQMLYDSVWGIGDSISACMLICMPLNLPLYTRKFVTLWWRIHYRQYVLCNMFLCLCKLVLNPILYKNLPSLRILSYCNPCM